MNSPHIFPSAVLKKAARVDLAVFDVDGVMTDGRLFLGEDGREYKCFHVRDGHGLLMLRDSGCQLAVITARSSAVVAERMAFLGIEHVHQGQADKGRTLKELAARLGVGCESVCYLGDDLLDLPAMHWAGLAVAVSDADPHVLQRADWVTPQAGGAGAVRALCELLLVARGDWENALARYQG